MNLTVNILQDNGVSSSPTPLNVLSGGISINGVSNVSTVNSYGVVVTNNSIAEISITVSGFHTYTTTINNVYSENKTIDIILVPNITDISDSDYARPVARFFSFLRPCGLKADVYNASSYYGEVLYYLNNEFIAETKDAIIDLCEPGNYQIKQRSVTYKYFPNGLKSILWDRQWATLNGETGNIVASVLLDINDYLEIDTDTNTTVVEYRPSFTLDVSAPSGQLEDYCCYTKGEEVVITSNIILNKPNSLPEDYSLSYSVENPLGEIIIDSLSTLDEELFETSFILEELGNYTVSVILTDTDCGIEYKKELTISTCNFIVISSPTCGTFTVSNKSLDTDVIVNIDNITGENILNDVALNNYQDLNVSFEEISLYTVTVQYEKESELITEIYIINNYCSIEDCIGNYILDIICKETDRCSPCPDETELNQILLLNYSYFMKLNKEYSYNNFYSGLTESKLEELTNLKQIMNKLVELCKRRGCLTSSFSSSITSSPTSIISSVTTCKTCGS
jgi:predicted Zn-dependent protease with MMP-like domain